MRSHQRVVRTKFKASTGRQAQRNEPHEAILVLSRAVVARLRSRVLRHNERAGRINKRTSSIIDAALVVLADGRPRTYIEIYTEARKRKLVANVNEKTWYNSIQGYVQRRIAGGRDSLIVQDVDRRFRLNHPADDWPNPRGPLSSERSIPNTAVLTALPQKTARGIDLDAFEFVECRAFEALGYAARHIGGHAAPDGYIDAPLGQLGYRSMLECKTSHDSDVRTPYAAEAAKYKDAYGAQYCSLIVPSFGGDILLSEELKKHDTTSAPERSTISWRSWKRVAIRGKCGRSSRPVMWRGACATCSGRGAMGSPSALR